MRKSRKRALEPAAATGGLPQTTAEAIARASLAASGFVPAQIAARLGPDATHQLVAEHQAATSTETQEG